MGITERIKEIEAEMARTQKNKATEGHLGLLKARLAKLRSQLLEPPKGKSAQETGFEVERYGHARVALIGFPSVGKSTLLSTITETQSEVAAYEFTTLTCIPGVLNYNDTKIQILDLPGIIEGAAEGKGRGRQVIACAKSADLILMVLDANHSEDQKQKLTRELESVGIRLNKLPADIAFKIKKQNGIIFNSTCKQSHMNQEVARKICNEYGFYHAEILLREDVTIDDFIDIIETKSRRYIPCLYVYNKIDNISIEAVDYLSRTIHSIAISAHLQLNLDRLISAIWEKLNFIRIYTKRQGHAPDFTDPLVLSERRGGRTIRQAVERIHRGLIKDFKCAVVWGKSTKHSPQRCGLKHELCDQDVMLILKKNK